MKDSVQRLIELAYQFAEKAGEIATAMCKSGYRPLLVGGSVRDYIMGRPVKDIDIEVYGVTPAKLEKFLGRWGKVRLVGQAFGVYRLDGVNADWSIPRRDSAGRKPRVQIVPDMSYEEAFSRRDLTINSIGVELCTERLIDPYGGVDDLRLGVLRATSPKKFPEDPLRLFRVMRFVSALEMKPDKALDDICKKMELAGVAKERIEFELDRLMLESRHPSLGFRWLKKIGRLVDLFPELGALIGLPQNEKYHPETDTFEHVMQVLDAAVDYRDQLGSDKEKLKLMYAAICHDMGAPEATFKKDGLWRRPMHALKGVPVAKQFLSRFKNDVQIIKSVQKLVKYHMEPGFFVTNGAKAPAYKRLAVKLEPEVNIRLLSFLSFADKRGRNPLEGSPMSKTGDKELEFARIAKNLGVYEKSEAPLVRGGDLVDKVGEGKLLGLLLEKAYEIQLGEGIKDKHKLIERVMKKR